MSDELRLLDTIFSGRLTESELSQHFSPLLIREMKKYGFLHSWDSGVCYLTQAGRQRRLLLMDEFHRTRRESIRYRITTGIALAALLLSVIALLAEAQVLPLRSLLGLPPLS